MAEPGKQPARSPPRPALEAPEAVPGRGCFPLGDLAWRRSWGHPSDETAAKRAQVRGSYHPGEAPYVGERSVQAARSGRGRGAHAVGGGSLLGSLRFNGEQTTPGEVWWCQEWRVRRGGERLGRVPRGTERLEAGARPSGFSCSRGLS